MDLKEIKAVIDLMTRNGLSEFELEKGDFKLKVKRAPSGDYQASSLPAPTYQPPAPVPTAPAQPPAPAPATTAAVPENLRIITSPMVGTFYRSPSPTSPAYIEVGQEVNEDTVVCIIEAMKVMNEIKAECAGIIVEVLAVNEKPVEYGKPLFSVRPLPNV